MATRKCAALLLLIVQLWDQFHSSDAFSTGAGEDACENMVPGHLVPVQSSPPPYELILSSPGYYPTMQVTVKLESTVSDSFKGYLVQARTEPGDEPVGTFTALDDQQQTRCDNEIAITHTNSNEKNAVSLLWTAPSSGVGNIRFRASVVKEFAMYWTGIESEVMMEVSRPTTTSSTTATVVPSVIPTSPNTPRNRTREPVTPFTTTAPPITLDLSGCGRSKGCFRVPENCESNCEMVATWTRPEPNRRTVRFELQGMSNGWLALGFSRDHYMGDDYAVLCKNGRRMGEVTIESTFNVNDTLGKRNVPFENPDYGISNMMGEYEDGVLTCVFGREIDASSVPQESEDDEERFFNIDRGYNLFLGRGPALAGITMKHTETPRISDRRVRVTTEVEEPIPLPPSGAAPLACGVIVVFSYYLIKMFI